MSIATAADAATTTRYDVHSMTVGQTVEYGPVTTRGVTLAIGPGLRGWVLVDDGRDAPYEVLAAELRLAA